MDTLYLNEFSTMIVIIGLMTIYGTSAGPTDANHQHITSCKPVQVPVETDPHFSYFPYFVKLYRCHGSIGKESPTKKKCVMKKQIQWTTTLENVSLKKMERVTLLNHTECKAEFVVKPENCSVWQQYNSSTGVCDCSHRNFQCQQPHIWKEWSADFCECRCPREVYSKCHAQTLRVDSETCACIPMTKDLKTGYSEKKKSKGITVQVGVLITMCVLEFAATVFFTIFFYRCWSKRYTEKKQKQGYAEGYIAGFKEAGGKKSVPFSDMVTSTVESTIAPVIPFELEQRIGLMSVFQMENEEQKQMMRSNSMVYLP